MPKFSVYVPDDLWADVMKSASGNPSQVVQGALGELVTRAKQAARLSGELETLLEQTATAVAERGRAEFEDGYRRGLGLAASLNWEHLRELAHSDPATWRIDDVKLEGFGRPITASGQPLDFTLRDLLEIDLADWIKPDDLLELEDVIESDDRPIRLNGIQQALIDTYNRVAPTWGLAEVGSIEGIRRRHRELEALGAEIRARHLTESATAEVEK